MMQLIFIPDAVDALGRELADPAKCIHQDSRDRQSPQCTHTRLSPGEFTGFISFTLAYNPIKSVSLVSLYR